MTPSRRPGLVVLVAAALTLALDQLTKAAVKAYLAPTRSIVVIPGVFELSYVRNTGAAFGLLAGQRLLFVVSTVAILGGMAFVWYHYRPRGRIVTIALGLVLGGALGNFIDRLTTGRVVDFLYVHHWPVFNIADSAVVVGVIVLVAWLLFKADEDREAGRSGAVPSAERGGGGSTEAGEDDGSGGARSGPPQG